MESTQDQTPNQIHEDLALKVLVQSLEALHITVSREQAEVILQGIAADQITVEDVIHETLKDHIPKINTEPSETTLKKEIDDLELDDLDSDDELKHLDTDLPLKDPTPLPKQQKKSKQRTLKKTRKPRKSKKSSQVKETKLPEKMVPKKTSLPKAISPNFRKFNQT